MKFETEIFIVCPINMEEICKKELYEKINETQFQWVSMDKGGFTVLTSRDTAAQMCLYLKIPTNILIRIMNFKCRDLPKLFNKVRKYPWSQWLLGTSPEVKVSTSKSRLIHSGRIEKTFLEGIDSAIKAQPLPKKILENQVSQTIHIRVNDDQVQVSLQASVSPLYQRKDEKIAALAPLRENFCAALYYFMSQNVSGYEAIIDPMCGSGSLLIEAQKFNTPSNIELAFSNKYIPENLETSNSKFHAYGYDLSESLIKNLKSTDYGTFEVSDAFTNTSKIDKSIIILNPPYGERLKLPLPPKEYYVKLIKALQENQNPISIGIIIPDKFHINVKYKQKLAFNNNSQKVTFYIV